MCDDKLTLIVCDLTINYHLIGLQLPTNDSLRDTQQRVGVSEMTQSLIYIIYCLT
jgi:hypothetical protein